MENIKNNISFIDRTALTTDELAFQCMALSEAALQIQDTEIKEVLLFILTEKTEQLYSMVS
ncbi:hypothetical protein I6G46_23045 [Serratia plymuthica]|uniref:hypothetical protein n=1 Tax=Serratia plymuthica TaxID=82996 RepID=UPI0018D977F8|nr:hypothetical protein [Serratia plymuthica]QPS86964.1 hypothetical protein I6G46_23045 [Serratia plymuthica]